MELESLFKLILELIYNYTFVHATHIYSIIGSGGVIRAQGPENWDDNSRILNKNVGCLYFKFYMELDACRHVKISQTTHPFDSSTHINAIFNLGIIDLALRLGGKWVSTPENLLYASDDNKTTPSSCLLESRVVKMKV
jgi:hypothetical protein